MFGVLPELDRDNRDFWTGGAKGKLLLKRCMDCCMYIHPPQPTCPYCMSTQVTRASATLSGTVYSYTVNRQPWIQGMEVPFTLIIAELDVQAGLRITGILEAVDDRPPTIGAPVTVVFRQEKDVWIPYFQLIQLPADPRPGATR